MRKSLTIFTILVFLILPKSFCRAADLDISCSSTSCNPSSVSSIFPAADWYPGRTIERTIKITNTSGQSQNLGVMAANNIKSDLSQVIGLKIRKSDETIVWQGTLDNFFDSGEVYLSTIFSGGSETYAFNFSLSQGYNNDYQNKSTSFNLVLGFITQPSPTATPIASETPTPTPTPVPGPTSTPGPGPTSTPGPGPTSTPVPAAAVPAGGGFFPNIFAPLASLVPNILGTEISTPSAAGGEVLAATEEGKAVAGKIRYCIFPVWFFFLLVIQAGLLYLLSKIISRSRFFPVSIFQTAITIICLFVTNKIFCIWWFILLSGILGVTALCFSYLKLRDYL